MSNSIEWSHASVIPQVLYPTEIEELAPDGNDAGEWGVTMGSDGAAVLYGSLDDLRAWAQHVLDVLPESDDVSACQWCGQEVTEQATTFADGSPELTDSTGSAFCEIRVPACGACDDGEPHPHEVAS